MATIEKYQTASGTTLYAVRYRTPDHRTTYKRGFPTKKLAEAYANGVEVKKLTGEYIPPSLGRITVGELAADWLARKKQATAPSHYRMLESAWRVHVKPRWGKVAVADVDVLGVEAWITSLGTKGAGATTVLRAHGVLSGILSDAVKAKRLAANSAKGVDGLPRKTGKRRVYLSADDVARLADESGEHRALVLVLAYTGIRWGEAVALRVRDVEFLRRRLSVHTNAVQLGVDHAVGPTKGRKARSVPVPTFVLDELSVQCKGKAPGDLVFSGPAGGGYLPRPKSSGGWFAGAVKRAKVQAITPHDLRHTCASLAVSAGVNVLALQRMLGHTSAKVTLDTYSDLFDDDLDAVAVTLHSRYSRESALKTRSRGAHEAAQQTQK
ncbi:tyrosine-type recombinase/integrase [Mycobacterium persicum]|uniref:tyrosine-type recombinase/integrase n=1 Tax=Mycobacterium persicum TaxID=1487726 RepID=UPI000A0A371F|nr:site-specific integrase [Mycobacterium persicum]ORC02209.1 site-specific integrase [Mycobacterium persicum]